MVTKQVSDSRLTDFQLIKIRKIVTCLSDKMHLKKGFPELLQNTGYLVFS
jgi:hypothetical protein